MNVYVSHDKKIVAFWTPKCACTAVVLWFYYNVLGHKHAKQDPRILLNKNKHLISFEDGKHLAENEKYTAIGFVRDPITRSASAFLSKFLYGYSGKTMLTFDSLESFAKDLFKQYKQHNKIKDKEYFGFSFYDYLNIVYHLQNTGARINPHWNVQFSGDIDFDFLVRVESFTKDLKNVNQTLGLGNYIPPEINKLKPLGCHKCEKMVDKEPSVKLLQDKLIVDKKSILSDECIGLIKKIYLIDFEKFNY
ncbi:MAG: sulfotransferase family protein [Trichodesmium sp. MAG_R01]|nr:sulfotransferase family protein [Trichodesmium sp. MAG_R01]